MKRMFTHIFKTKTRDEWVNICDGKDACLTPVLTLDEIKSYHNKMESEMFIQGLPKPPVELLKYDDVHE